MNFDHPKGVVFGAGAVGGSVGAWVARHTNDTLRFVARPPNGAILRERGVTLYSQDAPEQKTTVPVRVVDSLDDIDNVGEVDFILLAVKNYHLDAVAARIKEKFGDGPIIVAMQNGVENQRILPAYFSKVIYCIVSYNAWTDAPGVIGYQKHGPLYLGTLDNSLSAETRAIAALLNRGVPTYVTDRLGDAAHSKLVLNLSNSLTTLIGLGVREIKNRRLFQKLLTTMIWEGIRIIKAAGYREVKLGGMPPWIKLWMGAHLPHIITRPIFENGVKKMVISSMAQDVLQRGGTQSELESLNGYLLALADRHGIDAPYNRSIYALCKKEFAKEGFTPLDIEEVWRVVRAGQVG